MNIDSASLSRAIIIAAFAVYVFLRLLFLELTRVFNSSLSWFPKAPLLPTPSLRLFEEHDKLMTFFNLVCGC